MSKIIKNVDVVDHTYAGQVIPAGSSYTLLVEEAVVFGNSNALLDDLTSTPARAVINNGQVDITDPASAINFLKDVQISNPDGRMVVHQTPRKRGLYTYFSGGSDSQVDLMKVGGNLPDVNVLEGHHLIGDPLTQTNYMDFNTVTNETTVNGGVISWLGARNDTITLEVVPRVSTVEAGVATNYNLFGGYLVIPAAGNGTISVTSMKLVEVPINELGVRSSAGFWNATFNTTTKLFENVTPAPYGNGVYNIFVAEVVLDRFLNKIFCLGDFTSVLHSYDASAVAQGLRFKVSVETRGADHEWWWNALFTLFRKKTC